MSRVDVGQLLGQPLGAGVAAFENQPGETPRLSSSWPDASTFSCERKSRKCSPEHAGEGEPGHGLAPGQGRQGRPGALRAGPSACMGALKPPCPWRRQG